ncbi:hypothetical protein BpHYR1_041082 [Brachionus plicatilis]|uniref:Uncharacterized protein n=1 Tax=Brachionus plicatilis TaxID=10195 RepID=A0A3M7QYA3_BRAPC|nr:hypothetical protein BpHYR1_041082 [Brachionus plicatilis]
MIDFLPFISPERSPGLGIQNRNYSKYKSTDSKVQIKTNLYAFCSSTLPFDYFSFPRPFLSLTFLFLDYSFLRLLEKERKSRGRVEKELWKTRGTKCEQVKMGVISFPPLVIQERAQITLTHFCPKMSSKA